MLKDREMDIDNNLLLSLEARVAATCGDENADVTQTLTTYIKTAGYI